MRWLLVGIFATILAIGTGITLLLAWLIKDVESIIADPTCDTTQPGEQR